MSFRFQQKENYFFFPKVLQDGSGTYPATNPIGTGVLSRRLSCRGVNGVTHIPLVSRLIVCGATPPKTLLHYTSLNTGTIWYRPFILWDWLAKCLWVIICVRRWQQWQWNTQMGS